MGMVCCLWVFDCCLEEKQINRNKNIDIKFSAHAAFVE